MRRAGAILKNEQAMNIERRVPPNAPIAEMAVLGGVVLENAALDLVRDILTADSFYQPLASGVD